MGRPTLAEMASPTTAITVAPRLHSLDAEGMGMAMGVDLEHLRQSREKRVLSVSRGDVLFREGEKRRELYLVVRGKVALSREIAPGQHGPRLMVLGPGEVLGEVGAFTEAEQPLTASAVEDGIVWALAPEAALRLATSTPKFTLGLLQQLCNRISLLAQAQRGEADEAIPAASDSPQPDSRPPSLNLPGSLDLPPPPWVVAAQKPVEKAAKARGSGEQPFYRKKMDCPVCKQSFDSINVRDSYVRVTKRDSDLCEHYEQVNPVYYAVHVCPRCCYAAYRDDFSRETEQEIASIDEALRGVRAQAAEVDFSGHRNSQVAALSYQLALVAYSKRRTPHRKIAGLYHRLAWIARWDGDEERERAYLETAVQGYAAAYEQGDLQGPRSEITLAYLLGDLNLRLGWLEEATRWLGRAVYHPDIGRFQRLNEMVRDELQTIRQEKEKRRG